MTDTSDAERDFFVSFNRADRAWATWIAWTLEEAGYSVFVLEMDRAHTRSRRTIAVLSPDYLTSRFTAPEWAARFAQDATSAHDLLIPVRVRPCEREGLLAQIAYVDSSAAMRRRPGTGSSSASRASASRPTSRPYSPAAPATRPCPSGPRSLRRHERPSV